MTEKHVAILGVSQRDFFNERVFERVSDLNDTCFKVFENEGCKYIGVQIILNKGRITPYELLKAQNSFESKASDLIKSQPRKVYCWRNL